MSMNYLLIYLAAMNAAGFLLMGYDKSRSRRRRRRIPERTLFANAALGGALGVWAGMFAHRHKTKHKSFVYGIPAILLLNLACVSLVLARIINAV